MPPEKIVDFFGVDPSRVPEDAWGTPSFNVAPSQTILNVISEVGPEAGAETRPPLSSPARGAERMRWGMLLPWAKSVGDGPKPINARIESVASKPAFRRSFARQRSLVPADGFYEWKQEESGTKTPYYVRDGSGDPLALAAIWSEWQDGDEDRVIRSCALITVPASPRLQEIHDRMPALVRPDDFDAYLDPEHPDPEALLAILRSTSEPELEWYPVSGRVNSPGVNDPELIRPAGR